jgi:uncharacterized protein
MATDFDPYRILEVDPSAGREQIDEAYRRQWAAYPRDPAPDARLREIQAAYRILSDPAERRSYDERRQAAASAPVAVAEGAPPDTEASARLQQRVAELHQRGYELVSKAPSSARLVKKPRPQSRFRAIFWGIFWLCLGILPFAIYMFERKSTQTWYVWLDADGQVQEGAENPDEAAWTLGDIIWAVLTVIGIVIVASIPIFVTAIAIAGGSDKVDTSPNALAVELLASAVFQASALGAAWYFGLRKYHLNWAALGLRRPERGWPWLPFTLVLGALTIVFVYGIVLSIAGVKPNTDLPDAVYNHFLPLSIALVLTVLIAPVIEETFFRGFVFGGLMKRWGPVWGALGSGLLFGAAHLGNSGYFYVVPPIIGIGVLFAWSYRYSRSIFPSMAAHFLFNLIQMIGVLATR